MVDYITIAFQLAVVAVLPKDGIFIFEVYAPSDCKDAIVAALEAFISGLPKTDEISRKQTAGKAYIIDGQIAEVGNGIVRVPFASLCEGDVLQACYNFLAVHGHQVRNLKRGSNASNDAIAAVGAKIEQSRQLQVRKNPLSRS